MTKMLPVLAVGLLLAMLAPQGDAAETPTVAVLGAGAMGAASVRALVAKSVPTVVYNRSPGRLEPLVADLGDAVTTTTNMNEAIGSADIVFVMLTDVQAVETAMLHREDVVRALAGKIVVNAVSKASSEAVLQAENFLNGGVAAYVDMAMLCGPKEIGSPECLQLLAGPEASIAAVQEIVAVIGTPFPTGTSYGVAAAFDAGVLSSFFGAALGYMHGMAYVQAEGGDTSAFHNVVTSALPALLPIYFGVYKNAIAKNTDEAYLEEGASFATLQVSRTGFQAGSKNCRHMTLKECSFPDAMAQAIDNTISSHPDGARMGLSYYYKYISDGMTRIGDNNNAEPAAHDPQDL